MLREQFPQLQSDLIYLDSAATTLKPQCVIDALSHFYQHEYATVNRTVYTLGQRATEQYYQSRIETQKLINANYPEEIIFTRGTTHSINLLAQSFSAAFITAKDCVVLSEIEHHANLVPWQMAAEKIGFSLLFVRVDEKGVIDLTHLAELLISHRVQLISVSHVSNTTGSVQPIAQVIAMAHAASAYVAVDGAQAVAHIPLDMDQLDADFYAFSSHKMYGPNGVGVLYGKRHLLEKMAPVEGGGDMIEKVTLTKSSYAPLPHKFEPGTPAIAEVIAFKRAIGFIQSVGLEQIEAHMNELREYAYKRLSSLDVRFVGRSDSSLITFILEGMHPLDVAMLLDCKKIALRSGHLCSQPAMARFGITEALRISFGLYTTKEEIDSLVEALSALKMQTLISNL